MLNKYKQLIKMLQEECYKVDLIDDDGEETAYISNNNSLTVTISIEDNKLYLYVEEFDTQIDNWLVISTKQYTTVKGAYNFINKILA